MRKYRCQESRRTPGDKLHHAQAHTYTRRQNASHAITRAVKYSHFHRT